MLIKGERVAKETKTLLVRYSNLPVSPSLPLPPPPDTHYSVLCVCVCFCWFVHLFQFLFFYLFFKFHIFMKTYSICLISPSLIPSGFSHVVINLSEFWFVFFFFLSFILFRGRGGLFVTLGFVFFVSENIAKYKLEDRI